VKEDSPVHVKGKEENDFSAKEDSLIPVSGEEVSNASLKENSPVLTKGRAESDVSTEIEKDNTAPIAAEEESLLLDFDGESTSQTQSSTCTPSLPREAKSEIILDNTPDLIRQLNSDNFSFVEKDVKFESSPVIDRQPKPIPSSLVRSKSPNTQVEAVVIEEKVQSCANSSDLHREEETKVQGPLADQGEITGDCESEGQSSPSAEKDKLLEVLNVRLTSIMERAGKYM
jgi:hypothetical protein